MMPVCVAPTKRLCISVHIIITVLCSLVCVWHVVTGHALIIWPMKIIKVHMQNNEPGALIILIKSSCTLQPPLRLNNHDTTTGWYPPPGEDPTNTKYTLTEMGLCPYPPPAVMSWAPCNTTFCLFNVSADPCGKCFGTRHLRKPCRSCCC
jgi:hypothetical protein